MVSFLLSWLTPTLDIGSTWERPADEMTMLYIPAGEFVMGDDDGNQDERPAHTVYLDAFWIDQTEVTNAMYVKCMDTGMCEDPEGGIRPAAETIPNYPANGTWDMANSYCEWAGVRLPTEAEWEKAARGGLEGKEYPWGDEIPSCQTDAFNGAYSWRFCTGSWVMEVKSFSPNGYGLYDMAGNAVEWVADWYDSYYYKNSPSTNPKGPSSGDYRVLRGGSWHYYGFSLRSAYRDRDVPDNSNLDSGFRCSRSLP